MNYRFAEIVSRLLLSGSVFVAAVNTGDIHGMESPKVDIRGIKVNADEDNIEYYKREADKGDLSHQVNLAAKYYQGKDLDRDLDNAEQYFKLATLRGHIPSSIFLQAIEKEKKSSIKSSLNDELQSAIPFALEGCPIAQYNLAHLYYIGNGVVQDYEIAEKWFSLVISQKCKSNPYDAKDPIRKAINLAHLFLAMMYHQGLGVKADYKKSAYHLEIPATDLYPISRYPKLRAHLLTHISAEGNAVQDLTLYANYIILFAVSDLGDAGGKYVSEQEISQFNTEIHSFLNLMPLSEFKKLLNTPKKIFDYGKIKNIKMGNSALEMSKAVLKKKGSTQSDCDAFVLFLFIGNHFKNRESGDILKKIRDNKPYPQLSPNDYSSVKETLDIAEGRSKPKSPEIMPIKLQNSPKNTKNRIESPSIINNGHISGPINKKPQDPVKTQEAQRLAHMGMLYYQGDTVPKDVTKGLELMRSAADLGSVLAHSKLGSIYLLGEGVNIDYTLALKHLTAAADGGNPGSQRDLGVMYRYGGGVEQNYLKALDLFVLAANGGDEFAAQQIADIKRKGFTLKIPRETVEKYPVIKISNDNSTKSQKRNVNNTNQSSQIISQKEKAVTVLQPSKKSVPQKEVIVPSTRKKGPTSSSQSSTSSISSTTSTTSTTSTNVRNIPVREEKALESNLPQILKVDEKKLDVDHNVSNTSFPLADPVDPDKKEKKRVNIRIPKPLQNLMEHGKRTQEKKEKREKEKKEKKEKRTKKSLGFGAENTATEESSCVSTSCVDSDDKSHISISMSESEISESFVERMDKHLSILEELTCVEMKRMYPHLYKFIMNFKGEYISQIEFKNHTVIKKTLLQMIGNNKIEMLEFNASAKTSKITGNKKGDQYTACVIHSSHPEWYKGETAKDIIKHFFTFIAKSDELIYDFLSIYYKDFCLSLNLTPQSITNNNSPSRNENKGDESKAE